MAIFPKHTILGKAMNALAPVAAAAANAYVPGSGGVINAVYANNPDVPGATSDTGGLISPPRIAQYSPTGKKGLGGVANIFLNRDTTGVTPAVAKIAVPQVVSDAGKTVWGSVKDGLTKFFLSTPAGKDAENAGAKDWVMRNGLWLGGLAVVVVGGVLYFVKGTFFGIGKKKSKRRS